MQRDLHAGGDGPQHPAILTRRPALRGLAAGLAASAIGLAASPAQAEGQAKGGSKFNGAPDVVLFCDPALRGVLHGLSQRFRAGSGGAPVRMMSTAPGIMAGQLERNERCDMIVTGVPTLDALVSRGRVRAHPEFGTWRNGLVFATAGSAPRGDGSVSPANVLRLLAGGRLGVPDPTRFSEVDTKAVLRRLQLDAALGGRLQGAISTDAVAWMLRHGEVPLGLVLASEARQPGLQVEAEVAAAAFAPIVYRAGFYRHVLSRNAAPFMDFLATGPARDALRAGGLQWGGA